MQALGGLGLIVIVVLGALGIAVTVWVFWPAFRGAEAARKDVGTYRLAFGAFVALLAMNAAIDLPLAPVLHLERGLTAGTFLVAALSTDFTMVAFVYIRLVMPGAVTWTELGLRPLGLDYVVRMGLAAGLAGLVVIDIIGTLLAQVGLRPNQLEQFQFVLNEGPLAFVILLIAAGIVAPVVEEIFFRGFIFGLHRRRHPLWQAYLLAAVLFTVLHNDPSRMNLPQMAGLSIGICLLAVMLAWLYQRTGSLYPGILAHAVNNATGLILFYIVGIS
ncbi:MAG: CPBP family intramembrane metalloprotease [Chloroflexi bacterium]|nr:CPBP family intramembrane metalloprotease [Chloroflexota bacterium]